MVFEFGKYKIHIDVDKNKEFYKNAEWITDGCSCDGCNNYIFATKTFSKMEIDFHNVPWVLENENSYK